MKKVLAFVLAAAMAIGMSTVALAADITIGGSSTDTSVSPAGDYIFPDSTYKIAFKTDVTQTLSDPAAVVDLGAINFRDITSVSVKWTKGGAMVSSFSLKDKGKDGAYIEMKTNANYSLEDPKDLEGEITMKYKDTDGKTVTMGKKYISTAVSNNTDTISVYDNWDDAEDSSQELVNHTVYEADDSGKAVLQSETRLLQVRASLKDEQKIFMVLDEKTVYDVVDYLDDKGVDYDDLAFYNAKGKFSFASGRAEAVVNSDFSKKPYIYSWDGSKLAAVKGAKWNDGEGTYTVPVTGPFKFVLSNKALIVEKEESSEPEEEKTTGTTTNPDTGANDFVGLAVALAVVSVAGIAVAKKH